MTEWNIEGIAEEVIQEMKDDEASIDDIDYYIRQIAYWSVYSKEPDEADKVSEKVKMKILESFDE